MTAGFETIVRPVVFPVIRPARARVLAPADDPEKGVATLSGSGGGLIDLSFSESASWSRSRQVEAQRTVRVKRVKQKEEDGTINEENFVDIEEVKELRMVDAGGVEIRQQYAEPEEQDNVEIIVPEKVIPNPVTPEKIDVYPEPPPGRQR